MVLICASELIAHSRHGDYKHGIGWVRLYLAAQAADEDVQIFPFLPVLRSPDPVQEVGMGENLTCIEHELLQEAIFRWCQSDFLAGNSHLPLRKTDFQFTSDK